MSMLGALFITLSGITPASSIFVIIPSAIQQTGTGTFLGMAAAALIAGVMALIYSELGSAFPLAGGEYAIVGRTITPSMGFVVLGLCTINAIISPTVLALGASVYLRDVLPDLNPALVAVAIIAGATAMAFLDVRTNAWVTGLFLAIELVALGVIIYLGIGHFVRSPWELITHPTMLHDGALTPTPASLIGLATVLSLFAYNGYGGAVYFGEEMKGAARNMARTVMWALAIAIATEFVPTSVVLLAAPDLKAMFHSNDPFSDFVLSTGGYALRIAVDLGVSLAIINAVLAAILTNARLLFSSGRDRVWSPSANDLLKHIHPRFHSPWGATLVAGAAAIVCCFLSMKFLLVVTGTGLIFIYGFVAFAAIAGRHNAKTSHSKFLMPLFPVVPIVALAVLGYVVYINWLDADVGRPSLQINLVVVALSACYYIFVLRRRGKWVLQGDELDHSDPT